MRPEERALVQNFRRVEIDLSNAPDLIELPNGTRYFDVQDFNGDSLYIPPESAPVPVTVFINTLSDSASSKLPIIWPGGNIGAIYNRARLVFPSVSDAPSGIVIVILSARMGFSSGSVLIGAPNVVGSGGSVNGCSRGVGSTRIVSVPNGSWSDTITFSIDFGRPGAQIDSFSFNIVGTTTSLYIGVVTAFLEDYESSETLFESIAATPFGGNVTSTIRFHTPITIPVRKTILGITYEINSSNVSTTNPHFCYALNGFGTHQWLPYES